MKRNTSLVHPSHRTSVVGAIALLVALFAPQRAAAHDLKVMVHLDGDPIRIEAWFDDDTPAEKARVSVVRESGEEVFSGTTDKRGLGSFPKPGPGFYRIIVESIGHRDVVKLTIPGADPSEAPVAIGDMRLDQKLGLGIGLTLLLGGSLAFVFIRTVKRRAPAAK